MGKAEGANSPAIPCKQAYRELLTLVFIDCGVRAHAGTARPSARTRSTGTSACAGRGTCRRSPRTASCAASTSTSARRWMRPTWAATAPASAALARTCRAATSAPCHRMRRARGIYMYCAEQTLDSFALASSCAAPSRPGLRQAKHGVRCRHGVHCPLHDCASAIM